MKMYFNRLYLQLKSIRFMFFVPLIAVHLVIPAFAVATYLTDPAELYDRILLVSMIIIPVSSVLWSLFILRESIEGKGGELLFIGRGRMKLFDCLIPFIMFYMTVIVQSLIYAFTVDFGFVREIARMFFVCFFFFALCYFFIFITRSVALTLMVLILYTLTCLIFNPGEGAFIFYNTLVYYDKEAFIGMSLPLFALSVAFVTAGVVLNKKYNKF